VMPGTVGTVPTRSANRKSGSARLLPRSARPPQPRRQLAGRSGNFSRHSEETPGDGFRNDPEPQAFP
jgi:hypothetical protein